MDIIKEMNLKNTTPKVMVNYFDFLRSHHKYTIEKLKTVFKEYVKD